MKFSKNGINTLVILEGCILFVYDDQTTKKTDVFVKGATIGIGHLITSQAEFDKLKSKNFTKEDADALLLSDLVEYEKAVNTLVKVPQNQNQYDAMVIFCYNIGIEGFKKSSALAFINDPNFKSTAYSNLETAWKVWNKSQGKVMQGLINRRNAEWNLYTKAV